MTVVSKPPAIEPGLDRITSAEKPKLCRSLTLPACDLTTPYGNLNRHVRGSCVWKNDNGASALALSATQFPSPADVGWRPAREGKRGDGEVLPTGDPWRCPQYDPHPGLEPRQLAAAVTLQFFNQTGEQLESRIILLEGNGSQEVTLGGPTVEQIIDNTLLTVGWVKVASDQDVLTTAFYSLQIGEVSVPPVGVLPVSLSDWWSGVGEKSSTTDTAIALANPGVGQANCELTAHGTEGETVGSSIIQLGPSEQTAEFLGQLMPDLPLPFQGCLNLHCDQGNVASVVLTQRDSDGSVAAVAMDSSLGFREFYFPQALRGDERNTTRILIWNPGAGSVDASVRFFTQLGEQEEIRTVTLTAKATAEIILGGPDAALAVGWVGVIADGPVLSTAFYSVEIEGVTLPPVAVLPVRASQGWSGAGEVSSLVNTGLALANIGLDTADCLLQAYTGTDGRVVGSTAIQLPPRI